MTWEPTDEEARKVERIAMSVPLVDDLWREVLRAAWAVSPGPGLHTRAEKLYAKLVAYEARMAELEEEVERLRFAARGGNATGTTAELLVHLAHRCKALGGHESEADLTCAKERAAMLDNVLAPTKEESDA